MAQVYQGRGDALMHALASKYGPELEYDESFRATGRPVRGVPEGGRAVRLLAAEHTRLKHGFQMQILRSIRSGAEYEVRFAYYHRWSERTRMQRIDAQLRQVAGDTRHALLQEKFTQQQLESQVAMLRSELEFKEHEAEARHAARKQRRERRAYEKVLAEGAAELDRRTEQPRGVFP